MCVRCILYTDNSLWFAKHGSTFINLFHLSLIDIQQSSLGKIFDSLSPIHSLIVFSIRFVLADHRTACTFLGVTEGSYHRRIFRLFPSLRVCHLLFGRYDQHTVQSPFCKTLYLIYLNIFPNYNNSAVIFV